MRVVRSCKTVGYSGTDKTAVLQSKYLIDKGYDVYILYEENRSDNTRLVETQKMLGEHRVIPYRVTRNKASYHSPYNPEYSNFSEILHQLKPDIVHIDRSGYPEWPGFKYLYQNAKWVEHCIFGYADTKNNFDHRIYVSDFIRKVGVSRGGPDGSVIYNPVVRNTLPKSYCRDKLLKLYSLPENAVICLRVGRPDNFDPIALRAFNSAVSQNPNIYYIVVGGCSNWYNWHDLTNITLVNPISDNSLYEYYAGSDLFLHARSDGETCGTAIQESLAASVPVITHESNLYNAQKDVIDRAGICVPSGNYEAYCNAILHLSTFNEDYKNMSICGGLKASLDYSPITIGKQIEKVYDKVLYGDRQ